MVLQIQHKHGGRRRGAICSWDAMFFLSILSRMFSVDDWLQWFRSEKELPRVVQHQDGTDEDGG